MKTIDFVPPDHRRRVAYARIALLVASAAVFCGAEYVNLRQTMRLAETIQAQVVRSARPSGSVDAKVGKADFNSAALIAAHAELRRFPLAEALAALAESRGSSVVVTNLRVNALDRSLQATVAGSAAAETDGFISRLSSTNVFSQITIRRCERASAKRSGGFICEYELRI